MNATIFAALVDAQKAAKALSADSRNQHQGYNYTSAESLIYEGRAVLSAAGLALLPGEVRVLVDGASVKVAITYTLAHRSGETYSWVREWPAIEQKGRPLDKAVAGATTSALGYTIRDLLLLPRDDEFAAMDRRDDTDHEKRAASTPAARSSDVSNRITDGTLTDDEMSLIIVRIETSTTDAELATARQSASKAKARMNDAQVAEVVSAVKAAQERIRVAA